MKNGLKNRNKVNEINDSLFKFFVSKLYLVIKLALEHINMHNNI